MPTTPTPFLLLVPLLAICGLGACHSAGLPEGDGRGVLSFDREPPPGAKVYHRPAWHAGDRFVMQRGGEVRLPYRVAEASEAGYTLEHEELGTALMLTSDLAATAEAAAPGAEPHRATTPADVQLHWPLWVGKRWSCHYLQKVPGEPPLPLIATYHCDGMETVTVPAGTFECLRIWRRLRVGTEGRYLEQTGILWYAPEVGYFARRLENGVAVELAEYHRQS